MNLILLEKLGYRWLAHEDPRVEERLHRAFGEWIDTPYREGQATPKVGANCIGFGFGLLSRLHGRPFQHERIPADTSMHNKVGAMRTLHRMRRTFPEHYRVRGPYLKPGDVMIAGPTGGGPGHWRFIGDERNTIWEAGSGGVQRYGWCIPDTMKVFRVYRFTQEQQWQWLST